MMGKENIMKEELGQVQGKGEVRDMVMVLKENDVGPK